MLMDAKAVPMAMIIAVVLLQIFVILDITGMMTKLVVVLSVTRVTTQL